MDPHPGPIAEIADAVTHQLLEAVAVEVHEEKLAWKQAAILNRQRSTHESALLVVQEEHAVVHPLRDQNVPEAVVVPIDDTRG
jgi:hypothetical protein